MAELHTAWCTQHQSRSLGPWLSWWEEGAPCSPLVWCTQVVFALWEVCAHACVRGQGPRARSLLNAMSDRLRHHPYIHFANSHGVMNNIKGKCR